MRERFNVKVLYAAVFSCGAILLLPKNVLWTNAPVFPTRVVPSTACPGLRPRISDKPRRTFPQVSVALPSSARSAFVALACLVNEDVKMYTSRNIILWTFTPFWLPAFAAFRVRSQTRRLLWCQNQKGIYIKHRYFRSAASRVSTLTDLPFLPAFWAIPKMTA